MAAKRRVLWTVEIKAKSQWLPWGLAVCYQRSAARLDARVARAFGHKTRIVKYTPAG